MFNCYERGFCDRSVKKVLHKLGINLFEKKKELF